jgi:hypothetical protein
MIRRESSTHRTVAAAFAVGLSFCLMLPGSLAGCPQGAEQRGSFAHCCCGSGPCTCGAACGDSFPLPLLKPAGESYCVGDGETLLSTHCIYALGSHVKLTSTSIKPIARPLLLSLQAVHIRIQT